jgi:hypothetical protein
MRRAANFINLQMTRRNPTPSKKIQLKQPEIYNFSLKISVFVRSRDTNVR